MGAKCDLEHSPTRHEPSTFHCGQYHACFMCPPSPCREPVWRVSGGCISPRFSGSAQCTVYSCTSLGHLQQAHHSPVCRVKNTPSPPHCILTPFMAHSIHG
jgi:hypothetical protein